MKSKVLLPYAPILVESTRSIGYSFESAIADIVDNSISKNAKNININFSSVNEQYVAIIDDGLGMNEEQLENAMRYGSRSSLEDRDLDDLGRFGLGLKMASLSQCRKLTVVSKFNNTIVAAKWDLDYIIKEGDWALLKFNEADLENIPHINLLKMQESGTIVLWEEFDRIAIGSANVQKVFDEKIFLAQSHLALVFHRFTGEEVGINRLKIFFNNSKIDSIDPFLINNPATQPMPEHVVRINDDKIIVKPYILPYISKLSSKDKKLLGEYENLRQSQGFYIYRNKRLIVWGTWFRLIKQYELNKLARVRVDIPNTLDSIWEIDIKKSTASLPDIIKKNLVTIVENTVGRSEKVYKYRGRKINEDKIQHTWDIVENRGSYKYLINRKTPLYQKLDECLDQDGQQYLDSFLKMIEDTFPYGDVYYRQSKKENSFEASNLENEEVYKIGIDTIASLQSMGGDVYAFLSSMDQLDFFMKYPDTIKKIKEEYNND